MMALTTLRLHHGLSLLSPRTLASCLRREQIPHLLLKMATLHTSAQLLKRTTTASTWQKHLRASRTNKAGLPKTICLRLLQDTAFLWDRFRCAQQDLAGSSESNQKPKSRRSAMYTTTCTHREHQRHLFSCQWPVHRLSSTIRERARPIHRWHHPSSVVLIRMSMLRRCTRCRMQPVGSERRKRSMLMDRAIKTTG